MSMSSAQADRQRLFSPFVVAAFGLLVTLMLVLAFPRERLQERLLRGREVDTLTVAYLEAWLRIEPDNTDVLNELTREYLKAQRIADAQRMLARLSVSSDPHAQLRALKVRIELAETEAYALAPGDPARRARLAELRALLDETIGKPWDAAELEAFAAKARALNDGALAGRYYERLAQMKPDEASRWLTQGAQLKLAAGDHVGAANAFFAAQTHARTRDDERRLFLSGVQALQAGNRLADALVAADTHIGSLGRDRETLRYLTKLALAAGRPDIADRYAKRLLDMSARKNAMRLAALESARPAHDARSPRFTICAHACMNGGAEQTRIARIADEKAPPDPADFELGFRVFLANGDLAAAQRVAQTAVDRDPASTQWRERLAQVAEWNRAPNVALANYLVLARMHGDDKYWKQVERLAPGLGDNDAMLAAAIHESDRAPGDMKQLDRVVSAYEAEADPDAALDFLQARAKGAYRRQVLERYARLAERKGDDDLAMTTYGQLINEFGPDPSYALKLSLMYYTRARFDRSLAVLDAAKNNASPQNGDFWRFYAMMATLRQQDRKAREGYDRLVEGGQASPDDLTAMVSLYDDEPLEAGRIAEFAYRRTGRERLLELAIYDYLRARATARIGALLASLDPAAREEAERSPRFLLARAQYLRRAGDPDGALADTRAALAIAPGDQEARAALLWALNERGSDAELRAALARYARAAERDSALWAPYAAACLRLGDARGALHMMHKQAATRRDDPLWALGYADALELNGRIDDAWRVRNAVWRTQMALRASGKQPAMLDDEQREDLRGRMVGLTDQFAGGDASRRVLIELLREDDASIGITNQRATADDAMQIAAHREEKKQRLYSAVAREAALGWLQSHDAYDAESLWLLRQYIDSATRPVYAEVTIALAERDRTTLNRLLDTEADWIPRQNRLDAEAATGRFGDVQTHAYEQQFALPDDEIVNQILREQLLRNAQAIAPHFRVVDQGGLSYTETGIGAGLRLSPTQSLALDYAERNQHGDDTLVNVPRHDRQLLLTWRHLGLDDSERVSMGRRNALDDFTTFRVDGTLFEQQTLGFNYALGVNQAATETSQLIVGGMKDLVSVGFNYRPDPHVFVGGRVEYDRFHGQDRSFLGTGTVVDFNAGYKLRADYPDYTIRAVFTHGQYSASGNPGGQLARLLPAGTPLTASQFMPQSFTQEGVLFSFGDDLPEGYTRAWRPFFAAGPIHDSNQGWTAQVRVGFAGSVFGNDQALVYYEHAGATAGRTQAFTEYGVRYRWLY
ncbi:tetratricopeptide repeat protein [Caballeronia sp. LZ019]|uniref:tetratricopeptide repeat protein n=1 Tax=Caballeronia sp. LZ019 TaxID=3038555 RepID=UPI002861FF9F|nr:tetratricopeptide repeat protein [Caballeronia sp. LZ019]MDR5808994.1 tetratricopeptide repeat protein [Caballeronia sp. LZ019]